MLRLKIEFLRAIELMAAVFAGVLALWIFGAGVNVYTGLMFVACAVVIALATLKRDSLLLDAGAQEGMDMRPPIQLTQQNQILPDDLVTLLDQLQTSANIAQDAVAMMQHDARLAVKDLYGLERHIISVQRENDDLRRDVDLKHTILDGIAKVVVDAGSPPRLAPPERLPPPNITELRKASGGVASEYAQPRHRNKEVPTTDMAPIPAFLTKGESAPAVDLKEMEDAMAQLARDRDAVKDS